MEALVTSVPELNELLQTAQFLTPFNFEIQSIAAKECTLLAPFNRAHERPGEIISGITIMGAADVAMWMALMTVRGTEERWVTSDMKTSFLRGARKEALICTARVLKLGKRSAYGTVDTVGANSGLVAHHVVTYARVD